MADIWLDLDDSSWLDFTLIGIVAQEPDYRMAWLLNTQLKLNFKRKADFRPPGIPEAQNPERPGYSVFYSPLEFEETQFRLIGNKSHPQPCIKESEGFDFILQISNAPSTFAEEWVKQLRKISAIQWCGILKNISEKSLSLLIFDDHEDTT
jgi:hypothetical protein